jgi:hypothetical protein
MAGNVLICHRMFAVWRTRGFRTEERQVQHQKKCKKAGEASRRHRGKR